MIGLKISERFRTNRLSRNYGQPYFKSILLEERALLNIFIRLSIVVLGWRSKMTVFLLIQKSYPMHTLQFNLKTLIMFETNVEDSINPRTLVCLLFRSSFFVLEQEKIGAVAQLVDVLVINADIILIFTFLQNIVFIEFRYTSLIQVYKIIV